jgi:hypothetical protein
MTDGGQVRLYSKALVEENKKPSRRQDRVPQALNWFVRLAVSPEPEHDRRLQSARIVINAGRQGSKASYWPR